MTTISPLQALIELAASASGEPQDDVSVTEQFPEVVAPILRYQMLLKAQSDNIIQQHLAGMDKSNLAQAKAVFDAPYLLSLSLPYDGIQELCQELSSLCRKYEVKVPDVWQRFADGVFNWTADIDYMTDL